MAVWRVEIDGPLRVLRDGEPFRPRTRYQSLLILRLAAYGPAGIDRSETAAMLWPDAERPHQSAYLRRAIMELRRAGLEIRGEGDRIQTAEGALTLGEEGDLPDVEHPVADEIRRMVRPKAPPRSVVRTDSERLMMWIGETLVREHPEIAVEMLAKHGAEFLRTSPPAPVLSLLLRILSVFSDLDVRRVTIVRTAAIAAMYLTRYGLAERLCRQAINDARTLGEETLAAHILSQLAFLQMETRSWPQALETGRTAVEISMKRESRATLASCLNNYAGIQWHSLRFEEAMANYVAAYDMAETDATRRMTLGNALLIAGLYGISLPIAVERPVPTGLTTGSMIIAETNLRIGYGLLHGELRIAVEGVARLLRVASAGGMERFFCLALDYAAYAFARLDHPLEAAACVRIGSAQRLAVGHHRSPAESLAIRLHVRPPYFGPEVERLVEGLPLADPALCAERVAARLERALVLRKDTVGIRPRV